MEYIILLWGFPLSPSSINSCNNIPELVV